MSEEKKDEEKEEVEDEEEEEERQENLLFQKRCVSTNRSDSVRPFCETE